MSTERERVAACLEKLYNAKESGRLPAGVRPEQMEGVVKGLEFALFVIDNPGMSVDHG